MHSPQNQQNQRFAPTLRDWLTGRSASELATLARLWQQPEALADRPEALADALLQPEVVVRVHAALGPRERAALVLVQQHDSTIPAAVLEREFGAVREHTRYPNQRAYLLALEQPPTPTERLYTLALLLRTQEGPSGSYAIPPDLLALLPPAPPFDHTLRLADAGPPEAEIAADMRIAEHFLLALLTLGQDGQLEVIPTGGLNKASLVRVAQWRDPADKFKGASREDHWPFVSFLRRIAEGAGLLHAGADSQLRTTRAALDWLQQPPDERARHLLEGWVNSSWDELVHFLGMKVQNRYSRDLPRTKRTILQLLGQVPPGQWVAFDAFVAEVRRVAPDFARPDGRYDTWDLISYSRQPLDGFEHWDDVEGEQLRMLVGSTLRWLGLVDLGMQGDKPVSFRLNPLGAAVLTDAAVAVEVLVEPLVVQPNFEVVAPAFASPYARFQLGRVAVRTPGKDDTEIYKLTKKSIQAALERGIAIDDILRFLREQGGREPAQNVVATLREWAGQHGQVALRRAVLLEAEDAAMLAQIAGDKRVKLPPVERLTETAWALREADSAALAERLRKSGYGLSGDGADLDAPLKENDMAVLFAALQFYTHACSQLGIEGDVSHALQLRVARLLPEKQINRAYQASRAAIKRLKEHLKIEDGG